MSLPDSPQEIALRDGTSELQRPRKDYHCLDEDEHDDGYDPFEPDDRNPIEGEDD